MDPIAHFIKKHRLRIKDVYVDHTIDLLLVVLNNGQVVRSSLSEHARLRKESQGRLEKWKLIAGGTGVTWPELDEDLSLRGFIHANSVAEALRSLTSPTPTGTGARKRKVRKTA